MSRLISLGLVVTVATMGMMYSRTATLISSIQDEHQLLRVNYEKTTYHSSQRKKTIRHVVRNKQNPLEIVQEVLMEKQAGEITETEQQQQSKEDEDETDNEQQQEETGEDSTANIIESKGAGASSKKANINLKITSDSEWPTPKLTKEATVILVLSARSHIELRQVIRETWGSGHDNVYFVIGQYCPLTHKNRKHELTCEVYPGMDEKKKINTEKKNNTHDEWYQKRMKMENSILQQEQDHYHDMLWTPSPESYRGLPHKVKEGYQWVIQHLPNAKWIVKADDDIVVRVGALGTYLSTLDSSTPKIIGKIEYEGVVHQEGRWKEEKYPHDRYPPFPLGSCGHVVSRSVAEYISQNKDKLTEYQGEDTSLAIWMSESPLKMEVLHSDAFENNGKCGNPNLFIIGHDLSIDKIRQCYKIGDEVQPITAWQ
jgi:hypothetical protein